MQREMESAVSKAMYERAAELRDAIKQLRTQTHKDRSPRRHRLVPPEAGKIDNRRRGLRELRRIQSTELRNIHDFEFAFFDGLGGHSDYRHGSANAPQIVRRKRKNGNLMSSEVC
jgi:hypothetical protein